MPPSPSEQEQQWSHAPFCPMTCLPWTWEGGSLSRSSLLSLRALSQEDNPVQGWKEDGRASCPRPVVEGLHRLSPAQPHPQPHTCLDRRESRALPASAPHHFPFFLAGTFGRNELWRGGNHSLHRLPEHSHGQGVSKRGKQGKGEVTFEDREIERPADLSSCPSSAAYSTPRTWDGAGLISLKFIYLSICTGS